MPPCRTSVLSASACLAPNLFSASIAKGIFIFIPTTKKLNGMYGMRFNFSSAN